MLKWLKGIRKAKGFTQSEVARRSFVTQAAYCNIENGERAPSVSTAKKIAEVLDFDWTMFFSDQQDTA